MGLGKGGRGSDPGGTWEGRKGDRSRWDLGREEGGQIQVGHGKGGRGTDLGGTWEGRKGVRSRWDLGRVEGGQI